jgi:hypothetical protein
MLRHFNALYIYITHRVKYVVVAVLMLTPLQRKMLYNSSHIHPILLCELTMFIQTHRFKIDKLVVPSQLIELGQSEVTKRLKF